MVTHANAGELHVVSRLSIGVVPASTHNRCHQATIHCPLHCRAIGACIFSLGERCMLCWTAPFLHSICDFPVTGMRSTPTLVPLNTRAPPPACTRARAATTASAAAASAPRRCPLRAWPACAHAGRARSCARRICHRHLYQRPSAVSACVAVRYAKVFPYKYSCRALWCLQ